jgi:YVTN family beta-propeller protein
MNRKLIATLFAATLVAGILPAQSTPSPALLVLSKKDLTLSIVDPTTFRVLAHMPSGPDPHEVEASSDGKFAYISNYGFGAHNTITLVDLVAQKTLRAIDLGVLHGPHGLDFVGGKLYFTAEANKVIGSYDPATEKIDWVMGTGQDRTHMVIVWKDLNRIATTNVSSGSVSILEKGQAGPPGRTQVNWTQTVIPVGKGSEGFDLSPDGKEIWAANSGDGTISVIDVASKKVDATLEANVRSANRLKFTPDGKLVLVSCLGGSDLVVLDAATRREVKRIKLGKGAAGIQMEPNGARAFVACTPDDYVAVIDLKTLAITGRIDAGKQPDGLAWVTRQ